MTADANEFFPYITKEFLPILSGGTSFSRKVEIANRYFLQKLDEAIVNYDLMNAAAIILQTKGTVRTSNKECAVKQYYGENTPGGTGI